MESFFSFSCLNKLFTFVLLNPSAKSMISAIMAESGTTMEIGRNMLFRLSGSSVRPAYPVRKARMRWGHAISTQFAYKKQESLWELKLTCNIQAVILKVVSAKFLLVCFLCLKESTCETRKNAFYFTSKALFVFEIIKF